MALALVAALFQRRAGAHLAVLLAAFTLGHGLGTWEAAVIVPPAVAPGATVRLEGELEEVLPFPDGVRLRLAVARVGEEAARFRVLLYGDLDLPNLLPGQRLLVETALRPELPAANPGQLDLYGPRMRRGILFHGGLETARAVVLSEPAQWRRWLEARHLALAVQARKLSPSPEAAALFLTLAAGMRAELGADAEETFAQSGLAHVLSVSGLHVAALALMLLWALRRLMVRALPNLRTLDPRRPAAIAALPLVWAYVAFTGWQQPAVRSAVMASAFLLSIAVRQRADGLNSLALAAIAVLAIDPAGAGDLSLQLSFLAVLALILLAPALRAAIPIARPEPTATHRGRYRLQKVREALLGTLCASLAVTLAALPLTAGAFHRVSWAGLLANVIALPLCGVLTGIAAGAAAVSCLSMTLAAPLIWAGGWASQGLMALARGFAALPGATMELPGFGAVATALFFLGLGVFALARGRLRTAAVASPAAVVLALWPTLPHGGLEVTFLSVGHGDAIVLSSNGHHALMDGGGNPEGADTAKKYVLPFFRQRGIRALDLAVLSHPHADHALGLASALEVIPTRRVWLPAGFEQDTLAFRVEVASPTAEVEWIEEGHAPFQLGEATVRVLGPPRDRALLEGVNDRSVVLEVSHGENRFLLAGDIEAPAEALLDVGPQTVVKAPHHGSRTSSSPELIDRVRPRFVVFCVGANSRFGFPHEEVVERWAMAGARCLRTDVHGAVSFHSDGHDLSVESYLPGEPDPGSLRRAPGIPIVSAP